MTENSILDVAIIGGGPGGLAAGIYGARALMNVAMFERLGVGGEAAKTDVIENYPGFEAPINGFELMMKFQSQAERFGLDIRYEEVIETDLSQPLKKIITTEGEYLAKSVIFSTGSHHRHLDVPGEVEYAGKGVSYCATCDGAFFKDMTVCVVGGGDSSVKEAVYLTRFAKKVYIIHRRQEFRAEKITMDIAKKNPKIEFIVDTIVEEIVGTPERGVTGVKLFNKVENRKSELETDGVFIFVGMLPNVEVISEEDKKLILDEGGYIKTDVNCKTPIDGVYAIGDVRAQSKRQVAVAVGDGVTALMDAEGYVEKSFH
ncbi:thioredoxin-disulfide reductase [bacterium]|nr:thioredoxin-disulfide reductase [bacterium]